MIDLFSLGKRIREFRLKKGITQIDLARGLCTPSMISQIESDRAKPSHKILVAIAERLSVSIEHLLSDVNLDFEFRSKLKMAVGFVRAKEFRTAIPFLQELIDSSHPRMKSSEIHLELATCHLELGDVEEAITLLNGLYEWANRKQGHEMLVTTLMRLGSAYQKKGESALALFHSKRAFEELEKVDEHDPILRSKVLTLLGSVYEQMGKLEEAATFYEGALGEGQGKIEERGQSYLKLAETYHKAQCFEKAEEYAERASMLLDELKNVEQEQALKYRLVKLKSKKGDWRKSVDALLQIAEHYQDSSEKEKIGAIFADIAMICSKHGKYEDAWAYAERARLSLSDLHPAMGIVHRVLAKVYRERRDNEKVEKHLHNAIKIFQQHGKVAEFEEVNNQLCEHLIDRGMHKEAFELLAKFQSFMKQKLEQKGIVL
ncbi:helix-turn-helix domain-containing protein [Tumebacillus lipolyticus]|uniref:Helix-turn-helix domain-containing protein n=1 Tax=Tumebacillus lipolyticus TaxID=1280370 RepID=A0ABW5A1T6_9BACL